MFGSSRVSFPVNLYVKRYCSHPSQVYNYISRQLFVQLFHLQPSGEISKNGVNITWAAQTTIKDVVLSKVNFIVLLADV